MRFQVMHRYSSGAYGPWAEGDFVEVDPAEAEWVNHDSPGTLEKIDPEKQAADKRARQAAEEQDRQDARTKKATDTPPARRAPAKTKNTGGS